MAISLLRRAVSARNIYFLRSSVRSRDFSYSCCCFSNSYVTSKTPVALFGGTHSPFRHESVGGSNLDFLKESRRGFAKGRKSKDGDGANTAVAMIDVGPIKTDTASLMDAAIVALSRELSKLRTRRASAGMLDHIIIETSGVKMPLSRMAIVSVIDSQTLSVTPYDPNAIKELENAIVSSPLGINPQVDGQRLIAPIPPLTKESMQSIGAYVNQKLFRGFATTAAVREGHLEILEILLKAGASQLACEEALLEASYYGQARLTEVLMGSDMIRPHVAVHALVTACCRGFVDVVDKLMKCGVDANTSDHVLLQSSKPTLHTNTDCTALVAAIISRQVLVVRQLLQVVVKTDINVRLGAWSWDTNSGEEFRVGAGLAEPYPITCCAVEYFESSGAILRMLLQHQSPNIQHHARTLDHHAILSGNARALGLLLSSEADMEFLVKTARKTSFRPIHMASRLGFDKILQCLVNAHCNINSRSDSGETALMICARVKRDECLQILASAGANFGLVNLAGQCARSITESSRWGLGFQNAVLDMIRSEKRVQSSNLSVFSPLRFVAHIGDIEALKILIDQPDINLDEQDNNGFSTVMAAALEGHVEAFRLLVYTGADVKLFNKSGETAISLSVLNQNRELFEKVLLEYALEKGNHGTRGFYVLHCAARCGDLAAVRLLTSRGYDVNVPDGDDYTPLMLAAREGHGKMCELLIVCGARCDLKTVRGETTLSLARKNGGIGGGEAESVVLDQLSRILVLNGAHIKKHTKRGKGTPHAKVMRMEGAAGVLQWGKSRRRNVICREAKMEPSSVFQKNRERKGDAHEAGVFRVVTTKNKEFHFVCDGGVEAAELWVRGIKLVTREAISGKKQIENVT